MANYSLTHSLTHSLVIIANWAQLAGERAQTTVQPYIPQTHHPYTSATSAARPMWSARWGHTVVVLNQTSSYRNDLSIEENSERAMTWVPKLFVLGGDDYHMGELVT